ncbi:MAG: enoyl-CoA hydratase [Rhodospirillales bacterium]
MASPQPAAPREEPLLLVEKADGIARLTLNRPAARNALSRPLMGDLQAALADAAEDATVRVLVIAASGPAFSAGHDLREVKAADRAGLEALFAQCSALMTALVRHPKPVIAEVHGIATAAGCQLVASCDLAVAAAGTRFGTPGVNIGLFCSTPMVALSRAVGRKQALQMLLTGDMIDAETALDFGLINQVVPAEGLTAAVTELATKIASKSSLTLKIGKEAFYHQIEQGLDEAYAYASRVMVENMMARDAQEGISAFIEKRPPTWCGA